jgi:formylglycine-generating enzyme
MRGSKRRVCCLAATIVALLVVVAQADVFNMSGGQKSLETALVGNPGNVNDTETGCGSVARQYSIGKYEITNAQWREFLTAKARVSDSYGLYNTNMAGSYGGIDRTWSVDHYVYTAKGGDSNWDNRPVNYVSLWDAARFCNWLHNDQGNGDMEAGAYTNIGNPSTFARQSEAKYFIPTKNEWYKAAYYDPNKGGTGVPGYWDYPMMSDSSTAPSNDLTTPDGGNNANFYQNGYTLGSPYYTTVVGEFENSASAYGTFDQGGNLFEWNETPVAVGETFGLRGGSYADILSFMDPSHSLINVPTYGSNGLGFRVASAVPEPSSITMLLCGVAGYLIWRRRWR